MEAKHTPGPWNVDLDNSSYNPTRFPVRDKDYRRIVDVFGTYPRYAGTDEANARLIAAAPELLEALLEMTEDYCELCREEGRNGDCEKFPEESEHPIFPACQNVKRAKKAIAKAKGEA